MKYNSFLYLVCFSMCGFAMEPAVVCSALKSFENGNQKWIGVLSNGNKVVVDIHNKSLRKSHKLSYSGKIDKKKLTSRQAKNWAEKLEKGADYTCLGAAMKQVVMEQQDQ